MNNSLYHKTLLATVCALLVISSTHSAQADDEKPEQKTHTVLEQPLKIELELNGTAVADKMTEVAVAPQRWTTWTVDEAVAHGVHVRKGDVLVRFDTKKIDEAITDLEVELELTNLTIAQADRELPLFEKTIAMDTADAERAHRINTEDTQYYLDVEKALELKRTNFSLKSSRQYYENTLEELIQLEKMYEADDLVEETEEIILKRQRHAVAAGKLSLERATVAHERALRVGLPRHEESVKREHDRSELSTTKTTSKVEATLKTKQLEQAKQKLARTRLQQRLVMLQQDREAMVVHAPAEGTIYYGQCVNGKWGKIASLRSKLRPHGKVLAHEVIMTVISDGPIFVAATVPEAKLSELQPGMEAAVVFAALGKNKVKGRIESISSSIVADGEFAATLSLANNGRVERLTPGMSCKIKLVVYAKRNAILVPTSAVVADPWDDQDQHVILVDDEGNQTKQPVETGRKKEKSVEILSGLDSGSRILLDAKSKGE